MTEEQMTERAVALVLAMMRSASTSKIDPRRWWERAKTALETGAAVAGSFAELVSVMARKLEIEATALPTSETIASLSVAVGGEDFEAFRRLCEEQAVYVVAMAQAARQEQREEHAALFPGVGEVLS